MDDIPILVKSMCNGVMNSYIHSYINCLQSNNLLNNNTTTEDLIELWYHIQDKNDLTCSYMYKKGKKKGKRCGLKGVFGGYCTKHKDEILTQKITEDTASQFSYIPLELDEHTQDVLSN